MKAAIVIAVAASVMFGCDDDDETDAPIERRAQLVAVEGLSDLRGESDVRWTEGSDTFTATTEIRNDIPGSIRPWHVHVGSCATGGGIVGDDEDYPRLTVRDNGTAAVTVSIGQQLDPARAYHVNIHRSEADFDTIIACGDLRALSDVGDAGTVDAGRDAATEDDAGLVPDGGGDAGRDAGSDAGADGGTTSGGATDGLGY